MSPGYNHNIRYKDRLFHVQTEVGQPFDPWIASHLFLDGRVLHSLRTVYTDLLGHPLQDKLVRERMQQQHKEMMYRLLHSEFDALLPPQKSA